MSREFVVLDLFYTAALVMDVPATRTYMAGTGGFVGEAPAGGGGGTSGYIKVWSGSAWVLKPVKYWNGSAWVQKPIKFWNGSAWVLGEA